jgi:hypothetical protein
LIVPYCIAVLAVLLAAKPIARLAVATHPVVAFETFAQKMTATGVKPSPDTVYVPVAVGLLNDPTAVE